MCVTTVLIVILVRLTLENSVMVAAVGVGTGCSCNCVCAMTLSAFLSFMTRLVRLQFVMFPIACWFSWAI